MQVLPARTRKVSGVHVCGLHAIVARSSHSYSVPMKKPIQRLSLSFGVGRERLEESHSRVEFLKTFLGRTFSFFVPISRHGRVRRYGASSRKVKLYFSEENE